MSELINHLTPGTAPDQKAGKIMKKVSAAALRYLWGANQPEVKKHYLYERGSRHYRFTTFGKFYNTNQNCFDIIERGNDAPRGGQTGEFLVVKRNANFYEKWQWFLDYRIREAEKKAAHEKKLRQELEELGDQAEGLRAYFAARPGKAKDWHEKQIKMPSAKWRNWLRMKAASKVAGGRFDLLKLSVPEINKIMIDFI